MIQTHPQTPEESPTPALVAEEAREHMLNIPNAMSASRPFAFGPLAATMLVKGERGVTPIVAAMAASDAEGKVARAIDSRAVERTGRKNGYGTTELGKSIDPIADTLGFLEIAAAALKSPRTSRLGKLAVGIVLAQESVKSAWAVTADREHKKLTGKKLVIAVDTQGKVATGEKFVALTGAVLTHDLEPGIPRTLAGLTAVGAAVRGARRGERVRRGYNADLKAQGINVSMVPKALKRKRAA